MVVAGGTPARPPDAAAKCDAPSWATTAGRADGGFLSDGVPSSIVRAVPAKGASKLTAVESFGGACLGGTGLTGTPASPLPFGGGALGAYPGGRLYGVAAAAPAWEGSNGSLAGGPDRCPREACADQR